NRRAVVLMLVMLVLGGVLASTQPWATNEVPPPEIVTTLTDQCRIDPAHVPAPPPDAANYLHTCSSRIYDARGTPFHIVGVSWFGMETGNAAPDGLWARNWQTILDQLAQLGYNTIRLPYSNDILKPGTSPSGINYLLNPDLQGLSSLEILDKI